ncbi:sensor domain-containing diguanylate cyclase [Spirochaetia bacterium 38H-sp]|uniref:diguanylate cyclase n=1 Tax=Rarispira pelagica TaxID=3141764 RepID=A0ABU9UDM6_9SPIR
MQNRGVVMSDLSGILDEFENANSVQQSDELSLLKYYDLLKKIGIYDQLESYRNQVNDLEDIISNAVEILSKSSIDDVLNLVVRILNEKFIPSYLTVILQEAGLNGDIVIRCYQRLKQVEPPFTMDSIEGYKHFFEEYSSSVAFSLFSLNVNDKSLVEPLKKVRASILVPVIGMGGVYGLIVFGEKVLGDEYTQHELSYIAKLVSFVSISLQNNIHYRSSIIDFKTGLYNNSFFKRRLEEELYGVRRYGNNLSLIMMDVDHFKLFNDRYGHLAGDEVLISLARAVKTCLRTGDVAARYGGEEFVILLPKCSREDAIKVAERIRKTVEAMDVMFGGQLLKVTISLGVSTCNYYRRNVSSERFIEEADTALYESKKNGRNRVTAFRIGLLTMAAAIRDRQKSLQEKG